MKFLRRCALLALLVLPTLARAADIDGAALALWWGVPFAGLLLSIALMPLLVPIFWHHHFGKVTAAWGLAFLVPFALAFGGGAAGVSLVHALLAEYLPFVILLTALFTVAGGIYIRGNLHGNPLLNTAILAIGAVLASFMGTTGASMLLIRPLIRANDNRAHKAHVVVFFIFIVSNAGGSLTPLGDPPLFLGFLKGVDFFWTVSHIFPETLFLIGVLLAQQCAGPSPLTAALLAMLITVPLVCLACIARTAARAQKNAPVRLTPITRAQVASGMSAKASTEPTPALLTSTSTRPNLASACSKAASTAALSAMSTFSARPGELPSDSCAAAALTSMATTVAPSAEKARAIARPMPWPAPVTTATLSFNLMLCACTTSPRAGTNGSA